MGIPPAAQPKLHQTGIEPTHMAPEAIALSTELLVLYASLDTFNVKSNLLRQFF